MKYLILADLHANLEALTAVIEYVQSLKYDQVIILGDLVDYGPNPKEVLESVASLNPKLVLMGNHDYAVLKNKDDIWSRWTHHQLTPLHLKMIASFKCPPVIFSDQLTFVHASPTDNCKYMTSSLDFKKGFTNLHTRICFFGHTHLQTVAILSDTQIKVIHIDTTTKSLFHLCSTKHYFINPGSVGQPRDGNPQAAFAVYDSEKTHVSFFRVSYDYETTAKKFADLRLPGEMDQRIRVGK